MKNITISINKKILVPLFRDRVFKIAESLGNDTNFKAIYNIKHDSGDALDTFISDHLFDKKFSKVKTIVAEYIITNTNFSADVYDIKLSVPSSSIATNQTASDAAAEYMLSGMIADWIKDTVPTLLKQYEADVKSAEDELNKVIYTKKAPEL